MKNIFLDDAHIPESYKKKIEATEVAYLISMLSADTRLNVTMEDTDSLDLSKNKLTLNESVILGQPRYKAIAHIISAVYPALHSYPREGKDLIYRTNLSDAVNKHTIISSGGDELQTITIEHILHLYSSMEKARCMDIARQEIPDLSITFLPGVMQDKGAFLSEDYAAYRKMATTVENVFSNELTTDQFWDIFAIMMAFCITYRDSLTSTITAAKLPPELIPLMQTYLDSSNATSAMSGFLDVLDKTMEYVQARQEENPDDLTPTYKSDAYDPFSVYDDEDEDWGSEEDGQPILMENIEELMREYRQLNKDHFEEDLWPTTNITSKIAWEDVKNVSSHLIRPILNYTQRLLKDNAQSEMDRGFRSGPKIDGRSYIRGKLNDTHNYLKRVSLKSEKDYAIYLLFDISGSMIGRWDKLPSFPLVFTHNAHGHMLDQTIAAQQSRLAVASIEAFARYPEIRLGIGAYHSELFPLKSIRTRTLNSHIKNKIMNRILAPQGGNNDAEAILMGLDDLTSRPATKRLLVMLGDGQFCSSHSSFTNAWDATERAGVDIHVIVTASDTDYPERYLPKHKHGNLHTCDDESKLGPIFGKIVANWMKN